MRTLVRSVRNMRGSARAIKLFEQLKRMLRYAKLSQGSLTNGAIIDTIQSMADAKKIMEKMRREPANVRYSELLKICEGFFGKPRQAGTSHAIFKTPWIGDPRINIQNDKGKAKAYQVRQVLLAIQKLEDRKNAN